MEEYQQPILRSFLEKSPAYNVPNPAKAHRDIKPLSCLKPEPIRITLHEYPNENAIMLKGKNLWFSYKIGLGECEISTDVKSITGSSIQFNFSRDDSASKEIRSERVNITIFSHFSTSVQKNFPIEKVQIQYYI